jgi:hypothetical protein
LAAAVEAAHRALLEMLTPMVDDAGFNLVAESEEVTAKSTEAITGLVEGGVNTLQVLLTLRAEGYRAAGLRNEAAGLTDPSSLLPLQERFVAAASPRGSACAASRRGRRRCAQGPHRLLIAFGTSAENVFDLRREELRQIRGCSGVLEANNALVLRLSGKWRNWS